jgi:colanic acid/amylovoran biosynthesis glycosyltransferase
MRIAYVFSSFPFGARETFAYAELAELRRRGHDVFAVPANPERTRVHGYIERLADCTIARPLLAPSVLGSAVLEAVGSPVAATQATFTITGDRHLMTLARNFACLPKAMWLARAATRLRLDHIHAYWASTPATIALVASMMSGIPFSFTAHRQDIVKNNLLAEKVARASFVRAISEHGRAQLQARLGSRHVTTARIVVIHVGVDLPSAPGAHERRGAFRVLVPAALVPFKGHSYVLEAFALLRRTRPDLALQLIMAGDGSLRGDLTAMTSRLGLTNVVFRGQLEHTALLKMYSSGEVDAVALPSIILPGGFPEGIPVSLMEAMAYSIPVVATPTGGTPELVRPGVGLLVEERNAAALAAAIARLADDASLADALGRAGRQTVERDFAVQRTVAELELEFQASCGEPPQD